MTSKQYIEKKLRDLTSLFPHIQVRYEYIESTRSHFIEVIPAESMVENEDYMKEEAKITEAFNQQFPDETINFISNDSPIQIQHPDLILGVAIPSTTKPGSTDIA